MKLTSITWRRTGKWIGISLLGMACAWLACAQTLSTTTVQGTVYLASGAPASGTLQLSWPAFTTAAGAAVAAGRTTATIGTDGFVSVNLVPNLGSTPAGLYYTAVYNLSDGSTSTEYWVVPSAAQATIAQVRAQVMPAAQAVQAVSKAYVDQAIQSMSTSSLTASGGMLTGPLYLSGDPTQSLQAADKHYVDITAALALPLTGGTLSGPAYAAADPAGGPASRMQLATQHYVDTTQRYNVKDAGALGNGQSATVTTATSGGVTTVTCNACSFTSADVGKTINIPGAGTAYLQGGTLGTPTVTLNASGVVTGVTFSGYSGLPASATIPVTFSSAGSAPAVTAKGYVITNSSGVPTMHIWVGGMDYASAPTISVGWALDGATVLPGAGLKTTIASVVDATHVTLATAATTDVTTGVKAYYGTDDTTALNAAMQTVLTQPLSWMNGGQQFFLPCGTYLLSGPIVVNNSSAIPTGFRIEGSSMGCVKLVQLSDNTPILNFTQNGAWGFAVRELSFDYANAQSPNFTNSVSVYFNLPNGTSGNTFSFDVSRVMFYGGYRGIGVITPTSGSQTVWGYHLNDITGGGGLSGATVYLSNSAGDPRTQLNNVYSTQTVGEPVISIGVAASVTAIAVEADNAYGTPFFFGANHLFVNDLECELCYRPSSGPLVQASASDVLIRGLDDHAVPPRIGSSLVFYEVDASVAPTLLAGSVDIQQSVVKMDPCYNVSSGCTPPSHYAYIAQSSQMTAQSFKGNFVYPVSPETFTGSGMLRTSTSKALLYGTVTQQNLATSDGYYNVPNSASPYQVDAAQAVYQSLTIPSNLSSGNFSFLNGWQGAKVRVRLIQPPQGSGPFTVSAPGNVIGMVAPPTTNGAGSGTGATCTATIGSGTVTGVTCTGGTGYPASTQIRLQFSGGTPTASNVPVVPPAAYVTTDASGNINGSATMSTNGANYATAPTVGLGMAYVEQTFAFDQELSKWVAQGSATIYDGFNLYQTVNGATVPTSASVLGTNSSAQLTAQSTLGGGSSVVTSTNTAGCLDGYDHTPCVVAKYDATAQTASIGGTVLFTVGAANHTYRVVCYVVLTTAATTSSTLPNCGISYTDPDSGVYQNIGLTATVTSNTVGTTGCNAGSGYTCDKVFQMKAGTQVKFATFNYASSGTTAMQYAIHVKLEDLGQ